MPQCAATAAATPRIVLPLTVVLGCTMGGPAPAPPAPAPRLTDTARVYLLDHVPVSDSVRPAIRQQCDLGTRLPRFVAARAPEVRVVEALPAAGGARRLELEVEAVGEVRVGLGRMKSVGIRGNLIEGERVVGTFRGRRSTAGGFGAGFKGGCSFVGRCLERLAVDVAEWLRDPRMDSVIGE